MQSDKLVLFGNSSLFLAQVVTIVKFRW